MEKLTADEIAAMLKQHPLWALRDGQVERVWTFPQFLAAMDFVNKVAAIAEASGHHPDIDIRYNRVKLGLVTHDAGGLSAKDVAMVGALDELLP